MIKYINMHHDGSVETIDEYPYNTLEERKEFRMCLAEQRRSDPTNDYYASQRCTKYWKENE